MALSANALDLVDRVLRANPTHGQFLHDSIGGIMPEESAELDAYLKYMASGGHGLDYLAECYNLIVMDTLREQVYFQRKGRYRHKSYEEVAEAVYHNPEYMEQYMLGLALTLFLWPAHRKLKAFFYENLPVERSGAYLEIGPGHGFYLMSAMKRRACSRYVAVDISAKSVELTRDIVKSGAFGEFDNYEIIQADFLEADLDVEPFDAVAMGEVLEHVENPCRFLSRIRSVTTTTSFIYVSTCINAPAIDHISLFESVEHLHDLVRESGLKIRSECVVPYSMMSLEETQAKRLPINIAMSLEHA